MAGGGFSCDDYPLVSEREDEMKKSDAVDKINDNGVRAMAAAAPELLGALEELKKMVGIWWPGSVPDSMITAVERANLAIKKAKGE